MVRLDLHMGKARRLSRNGVQAPTNSVLHVPVWQQRSGVAHAARVPAYAPATAAIRTVSHEQNRGSAELFEHTRDTYGACNGSMAASVTEALHDDNPLARRMLVILRDEFEPLEDLPPWQPREERATM